MILGLVVLFLLGFIFYSLYFKLTLNSHTSEFLTTKLRVSASLGMGSAMKIIIHLPSDLNAHTFTGRSSPSTLREAEYDVRTSGGVGNGAGTIGILEASMSV